MKKILLECSFNKCFGSDPDFIQEKYIIFEGGKCFFVKERYLEHDDKNSPQFYYCERIEIPLSLGKFAEEYLKS